MDPLASGLMIVLVNKATKLSDTFLKFSKEYIAKIKFGIETDTFDIEGKIISRKDISGLNINDINIVLDKFKGLVKQTPPMYSALKHNGKPLYKIARMGRTVERRIRDVKISEIEVKGFDGLILTIRICCSSGTYIRSLADDIGKTLGTGAVLYELKRIKIGEFCLEGSIEVKQIADFKKINTLIENKNIMISIGELLRNNHPIFIKTGQEKAIINGKRISPGMIDYKKTDIDGLDNLNEKGSQNFKSMLLVKDSTGSVLAVHRIIKKIKFDDIENLEQEFTKSIVIF